MNGLVTVIIPVFNTATYLTEALDSVVQQTYKNLEIIIIDDGSTDGSEKICDDYANRDKRIVLVHQKNNGLSYSRNIGLKLMTGEVVVFLDSDDAFHPEYIEIMMGAMIREKSDVVVCKYILSGTTGIIKRKKNEGAMPSIKQGSYGKDDALRALADGLIDHHSWNKMYKAILWESIRFPEGHVYEDIDTTYRIFEQCCKIVAIDNILYHYRDRCGSIAKTCTKENISDLIRAQLHFEFFVKDHTPDLFSATQYNMLLNTRLKQMLHFYIMFMLKNSSNEKRFRDSLREQILEVKNTLGRVDGALYYRIGYWLICVCPWTLSLASPVYRAYKTGVK